MKEENTEMQEQPRKQGFLGCDCVANTDISLSVAEQVPHRQKKYLCSYFSNARASGGDASMGDTRSHPEHDG